MTCIERRYQPFEACYVLRLTLGPAFGNFYTLLADQRRGKATPNLRHLKFVGTRNRPYYLHSDIYNLIEEVRSNPATAGLARAGALPQFKTIDYAAMMEI